MAILNPGNILPFYEDIKEQWRYRFGHEWGIAADVNKLIPFQYYTSGAVPDFYIVKADGSEVYPISSAKFSTYCHNSTQEKWVTWMGDSTIVADLPCGLYYVMAVGGRGTHYSEVMDLRNVNEYERAGLSVSSCTNSDAFTLSALDSVNSTVTSETIELYDGTTWNEIGTTSGDVPNTAGVGDGATITKWVRRTIETENGNVLTTYYSLYFDFSDACGTYVFQPTDTDNYYARRLESQVEFWNDEDIENILYTQGYKQRAYISAHYARPVSEIEEQVQINGLGERLVLSANNKERAELEFPFLPDFWAYPFANIGSHSTKRIYNYETNKRIDLEEYSFSHRNGADGFFGVGTIQYLAGHWYATGCEEDEDVSSC